MLTAEARIQAERPSRHLVQLCRHANSINHKMLSLHAGRAQTRPEIQHVEWTDTRRDPHLQLGTVHNAGRPRHADGARRSHERGGPPGIQNLITTRNLERFGRRDRLKVTWQRPAPAAQAGEAG